jgi:hypothetical protein
MHSIVTIIIGIIILIGGIIAIFLNKKIDYYGGNKFITFFKSKKGLHCGIVMIIIGIIIIGFGFYLN